MKNKISFGVLVLTLTSLVACQEGLSSSSLTETSSESTASLVSLFSEPVTSSTTISSSKKSECVPIDPSASEIDVFSKDVTYELDMTEISEEAAQELVANDISKYPEEQASHKKTTITSTKEESHVTTNRSSSTYSVKDLVEEKHTISRIDGDLKWFYGKSIENTVTTYFVEDPLVRHTINERLFYVKDNCFYRVYAEKSFYEGMEDRGTYEAYYYKLENANEEEYIGYFAVPQDGYTYFNSTHDFGRLSKTLLNNYSLSSSFYEADNYSLLETETDYKYYSSGAGSFSCIAKDTGDYHFSDLKDYPTMEKNSLDTISYEQDYLLNISNYFTYEEDYLTKSVSKKSNGSVIRNEKKDGRKIVTEGCETFYPDLTKFELKEDSYITK